MLVAYTLQHALISKLLVICCDDSHSLVDLITPLMFDVRCFVLIWLCCMQGCALGHFSVSPYFIFL